MIIESKLLILSAFQAIAEFLPISSSSHVLLLQNILNYNDFGFELRLILHLGSLLALIAYFYQDIILMIKSIFSKNNNTKNTLYKKWLYCLVISAIPAVITGIVVKKIFGKPSEDLKIVAISSIIFGSLMLIAQKYNKYNKELNFKNAFLIGIGQCFAFIAGASRLGSTLTSAYFLSLKKETAIKFCFLSAIPVLSGACVFGLKDVELLSLFGLQNILVLLIVFLIGILSISTIIKILNKFELKYFAIYRIIFGILLLLFLK